MRNYNPSLIKLLENDHKKLFDTYMDAKELFEQNGEFEKITDKLDDLQSLLVMHINFENSLLYSYLEGKYEDNSEKLDFIESADKEMQTIVEVAMKFIEDCSCLETFTQKRDEFIQELNGIGEILVKRVKFEEEQLYALYKS